MRNKCFSRKNVLINPDGETLFPCVNIPEFEKKLFRDDIESVYNDYNDFFSKLGSIPLTGDCKGCGINDICQAGCLAMRPKQAIRGAIPPAEKINDI